MTRSDPAQLSDGPPARPSVTGPETAHPPNPRQAAPGPAGGAANRPVQIPVRGLGQVGKRIFRRFGETQLSLISAGVAFFGLLAIFPALSALVAVSGFFLDPSDVAWQMSSLLAALPPAAAEILSGQLNELAAASGGTLSWALTLSILLAVFSASRGTLNLMNGLNIAYEEREERGFFKLQLVSLGITLAALVGFIATLALVGLVPVLASAIGQETLLAQLILVARWPLLLLIAVVAFGLLYKFGPSRRPARWTWITPGAGLAVAIWLAATVGLSWYVQTFGRYAETFGAIAGAVVLMLWLFVSSFALLFGALIDAELEAQTAVDSTVGEDRPLGERGAVKADTVEAVP